MLDSIKTAVAERKIRKEAKTNSRTVRAAGFDHATKVGILFDAPDENAYRMMKEFVLRLREEGIRHIKAIGYVPEKEIPFYLTPKLEFDYFSKKDLNWHYKPVSKVAQNFADEEFDILINLSTENSLPLKHLLASSKSGMKVGKFRKTDQVLYDMMLEVKQESLSYLISQVEHYLSMLNKQPNAH